MEKSRETRMLRVAGSVAAGAIMLVLALGCQSSPPQISIRDAKATLSPAVFGEAMVTLTIVNTGGADALENVKTSIPGSVATIHSMEGRRMVKVDIMRIGSKRDTSFVMGGDHIMITNIPRDLKAGTPFTLTLVFQKSGEKQIPLTLEQAPMPMDHGHDMNK